MYRTLSYYQKVANTEIHIFYREGVWNVVWSRRKNLFLKILFDNTEVDLSEISHKMSFSDIKTVNIKNTQSICLNVRKEYKLLTSNCSFSLLKNNNELSIELYGYTTLLLEKINTMIEWNTLISGYGKRNQKLTKYWEILEVVNEITSMKYEYIDDFYHAIGEMIMDLSDIEYQNFTKHLPNLDDDTLLYIMYSMPDSMYSEHNEKELFNEFVRTDRIKLFGKLANQISVENFFDVFQEQYEFVELKLIEYNSIEFEHNGEVVPMSFLPILFTQEDKTIFIQKYKEMLEYNKLKNQ